MNRPGYNRVTRRPRIRLTLEHLECRRVMAGLNVLVFADHDGSRSHSGAAETPVANRLVYVDLNRDLAYNVGEPLAISDSNGLASFPDLPTGDYLIGLAANHRAQVITTSVIPDAIARPVSTPSNPGGTPSTNPGINLGVGRAILASADLQHAWALSDSGVLTPVGDGDSGRLTVDLGGRVLGYVGGAPEGGTPSSVAARTTNRAGWVLLERSSGRTDLIRLDFEAGKVEPQSIQGLPAGYSLTGLARAGQAVYVQLRAGSTDYLATLEPGTPQPSTLQGSPQPDQPIRVGMPMPIPTGRVVGSGSDNRVAILASRSSGEGDAVPQTEVIAVHAENGVARSETLTLDYPVSNLSYSADGELMFIASSAGGVEVYSTSEGLRSVAVLADAAGPVAAGSRDGRIVTGSSSQPNALIVWNRSDWSRAGQIKVEGVAQSIRDISVDDFGQRLLALTPAGLFAANLANPAPQPVKVAEGRGPALAHLGVRLTESVPPLPTRVSVGQATDEDVPLELDLNSLPEVAALGSGALFFLAGTDPQLGKLSVSPSGRVTYLSHADANGSDNATVRIYDGIGVTTLVVSLDVWPVNDPPTDMTIDTISFAEAAAAGQLAGLITIFDVDVDARYAITTNDSRFVVLDGQLLVAPGAQLDYETEPEIELEITATDLDNPAFVVTRRVRLNIEDSNDPPTSVNLRSVGVAENTDGAVVGIIDVSDPDWHGQYLFTVSDERFEIDAGQLRLRSGVVLDFETEPFVSVEITVTDPTAEGPTQSATSVITVNVIDRNDPPTGFTIAGTRVRAGEPGAVVGAISVQDKDAHDEFRFDVSDDRFTVDGNVLRLKSDTMLLYGSGDNITVLVTVTDSGGAAVSQPVKIDVISDKPFHNARNPMDVDNDGGVYPRDVLILINRLNQKGSHILTPVTGEGDAAPEPYFLDVNGDGMLTPMDVLIIVNHLNKRATMGSETNTPGSSGGPDQEETMPDSSPNGGGRLAAGEGEGADEWDFACAPWIDSQSDQKDPWQIQRDAIDRELEQLVEQLASTTRAPTNI